MKPHRTDAISLVFGLLFSVVALLALTDALVLSGALLRWSGAGVLVLVGVILLATARGGDRNDESPPETHDIS